MAKYFGGGGEGAFTSGIIRQNLAALTSLDSAAFPNGVSAYVISEREHYVLDTLNPLTTYSPLIIARGAGSGKWYRRSRAYVVGNFTLWCQSFNYGIAGYTPGQLLVTGATNPDILLDCRPFQSPSNQRQLCVDMLGNIWLTPNWRDSSPITVRKYLLKDCLVSGLISPSLSIPVATAGVLTESGLSIFDKDNGLWTMIGGHGGGAPFNAVRMGQRAYSSNSGVPSINLTAFNPPSTSTVQDMLFDAQGNLWVSVGVTNAGTTYRGGMIMFTKAQCMAGGTVAPTVFWTGVNFDSVNVGGCCGIAISPNNLMWATDYYSNRIRAWNMIGAVSGDPVANIIITCVDFNGPYSITFDAAGNLWVSNGNNSKLMRIPAASLTASGVVVPDVIITPPGAVLTSNISFPNNPDRSGLIPSGSPIAA